MRSRFVLINLTRGGADDDVRAADAPLAVPDGARPPLQLRDLVDEADALDERPALPAPAARPRALGHLLLLTEGAAEEKEGKQSREQCGEGRCPHGRRPDVFGVVDSRDNMDCSRALLEVRGAMQSADRPPSLMKCARVVEISLGFCNDMEENSLSFVKTTTFSRGRIGGK